MKTYHPLIEAARTGNIEALNQQLAMVTDPDSIRSENGSTALHFAAFNGHVNAITALLEKGADREAKANNGTTPLHWAASNGQVNAITALLEKGADREAKDNTGYTPLHFAAFNGHVNAITALLEKGADREAKTNSGLTPLHVAANKGHVNAITALLEKGADREAKDIHGLTPLHWAAAAMDKPSAILLLLSRGANLSPFPASMKMSYKSANDINPQLSGYKKLFELLSPAFFTLQMTMEDNAQHLWEKEQRKPVGAKPRTISVKDLFEILTRSQCSSDPDIRRIFPTDQNDPKYKEIMHFCKNAYAEYKQQHYATHRQEYDKEYYKKSSDYVAARVIGSLHEALPMDVTAEQRKGLYQGLSKVLTEEFAAASQNQVSGPELRSHLRKRLGEALEQHYEQSKEKEVTPVARSVIRKVIEEHASRKRPAAAETQPEQGSPTSEHAAKYARADAPAAESMQR